MIKYILAQKMYYIRFKHSDMKDYTALHSIASVLLIISWIDIVGGAILIFLLYVSQNSVDYSTIGTIAGYMFFGVPLMAFAKLIDLLIDIANSLNKKP